MAWTSCSRSATRVRRIVPIPEGVHLRQFARVNNEAALTEPAIEGLEREPRVRRIMEGGDEIALHGRIQIGAKSQLAQARQEDVVIATVAGARARADPALEFQFDQRLVEREQGVRRRRVAELAVGFEAL